MGHLGRGPCWEEIGVAVGLVLWLSVAEWLGVAGWRQEG